MITELMTAQSGDRPVIDPQEGKMTHLCPLCGKKESLVCDEDLGNEGMFFSCHETGGGCGATFRITPDGKSNDIF